MRSSTTVKRLFIGFESFVACLLIVASVALYGQITKKPLANTAGAATNPAVNTVTPQDLELRNGVLQAIQKENSSPAAQSDASRQAITYDDTSITIDGTRYNVAQIEASLDRVFPQLEELINYILQDSSDTYDYSGTDALATLTAFYGYTNGQVGVNDPMTRAQAASIIARVFGLQRANSTTQSNFSDVDSASVHARNIDALYENGITSGCATAPLRFCPSNTITRRQFAVLFGKAVQKSGKLNSVAVPSLQGFSDVASGSSGSSEIDLLTGFGLLKGCDGANTKFCPDQTLNRGEAARIVTRYFHVLATTGSN